MRKILIAAFTLAFVSVQAISTQKLVKNRLSQVAEITSLPKSGDFEFVGCFADKPERAIPTYNGDVKSADACRAKAEANKHDVFGLQYGGQCFTGKLDTVFGKYGKGPAAECNSPLGGTWTNMVFKKKFFDDQAWEYKGCFRDDAARTIANYLGEVKTKEECQKLAEARGFNTFGLQFYSQCFGASNPNYSRLGAATNCGTMGTAWTNNVYQKKAVVESEWQFKGCFKDDSARTIANYLGEVKTKEDCQKLAEAKGFNTFGLQFYSQCFGGSNSNYARLGAATNCGTMGTAWTNNVYVKVEGYKYRGCFKDNNTRMVPIFKGMVTSVDGCKKIAIDGKFDTFSLQYGGQCFVGNKSAYNRLGEETNKANCPTLGGTWSNQVYSL